MEGRTEYRLIPMKEKKEKCENKLNYFCIG